LRLFDYRVLRKIFESDIDGVTGEWETCILRSLMTGIPDPVSYM
jgi:hypothetical protein